MDKQAFLKELRGYLSILEDQEQEDILEEYSQHIDMKLQKGLSEEEAIQDFGSMKELAAEILEAYHVKPEFRQQKTGFCFSGLTEEKAGNGLGLRHIGGFLKKKFAAIGRGIKSGYIWILGKCRAFAGWAAKPYRVYQNRKMDAAVRKDSAGCRDGGGSLVFVPAAGQQEKVSRDKGLRKEILEKGTKKMAGSVGRFFCKTGKGIAAAWGWFLTACLWGLRLMWNAGWLVFALFCGIMAMFVLAGLGAALVLLAQGYPLFGLSLIILGGILCFGSLSGLACSMIIRKKTEKGKKEEGTAMQGKETEKSGEVQYE